MPAASRRVVRGAVAAVVVAALAVPAATGAGAGDTLLFAAYHLVWVLGPGVLAARALLPGEQGALRLLVMGWALGYAMEIAAFAGASALGLRPAFFAWPLVVLAALIAAGRLRSPRPAAPGGAPTVAVVVAAVALAGLLLLHAAAVLSDAAPLSRTQPVSFAIDVPWHIALTAEAGHRWPVRDPQVSGEPLPYHLGSALDGAAAEYVTGIGADRIVGRLQPLPLILATVAGFLVAGTALFGSAALGAGALALFLIVGDPLGDVAGVREGGRVMMDSLLLSPSSLLGLVFWIPALLLLHDRLRAERGRAEWIALALVLVGAGLAKGILLPMLVGGLGLLAVLGVARRARPDRALLAALALTGLLFLVSLVTVYRGAGPALRLDPLRNLWTGVAPGAPLSALALLFPAAGLLWVTRADVHRLRLLAAVSATGLGALLALANGTGDEYYFLQFALVPLTLMSAYGLRAAWERRSSGLLRWGLLAAAGAVAAWGVAERGAGAGTAARVLGPLVAVAAVMALAGRRGRPLPAALLLTAALLLVAAAVRLPFVEELRSLARDPDAVVVVATDARDDIGVLSRLPLAPDVAAALDWMRRRTPAHAVLVAPDVWNGRRIVNAFGYAAFSERRTVIGGPLYSRRAATAGYDRVLSGAVELYAARSKLQERVYRDCDRLALTELQRRYGATHLLIDRTVRESYPACVDALGRRAFTAPQATLLELRPEAAR